MPIRTALVPPVTSAFTVVPVFVVVSALLLSGCGGPGGEGKPGAAGVDDPYFPRLGNGGYDVRHYGLTLDYDPESGRLEGEAEVTARATQDLSAFNLDLLGMTVRTVTVDGKKAAVSRTGQELTVRPPGDIADGAKFVTKVRYRGKPRTVTDEDDSQEGWLPTEDGALALGEPTGSMTWFPGNHHPSDKASYDIEVTVPKGLKAVSNGELKGERNHGGNTTFTWRSAEPMASYLATVAVGDFETKQYAIERRGGKRDANGSGTRSRLPVYTAVERSQVAGSRKVLGRLEEVVRWQEGVFGPYPFGSAGAVVGRAQEAGYALETQTRPVYPGPPEVELVVHEMAHQWYGNSVTPKTWRDLWLNEGFATYAEWLWEEEHGGDSAEETFQALYSGDFTDDPDERENLWAFPPAQPPSGDRLFDSPVYERGAMVLHKVRQTVGDKAFRTLLRGWASSRRHGNASTADFTAYAEKQAGAGHRAALRSIWKTWLNGDGRPAKP
ncbi:Aminopeptidase N [Streptomyces sp. YIM 130001]|uniref:M1 family metallopeptidase n=1 Tax=Streptomyces sp. YIM 130001 TaxID=2259644 RepID=UPI000E6491EB|nr:M1 family metallopeptidase [Streptomyces sp. YIM 130001]RII13741.1 Aminopeptidase N [Streptomyces sp. YIM 130001]